MITLENKKIHDFIIEKDELVNEGRKITKTLEDIERKIENFEKKEKEITGKVKPNKELEDEGNKLAKLVESSMERLQVLGKQIEDEKLLAIPLKMKEEHQALMKQREELERDRNKIALKVQKIKDRIVPVIQKLVKPMLQEYDDIETARVKDGKVVINTFNHLNDWKRKFKSK